MIRCLLLALAVGLTACGTDSPSPDTPVRPSGPAESAAANDTPETAVASGDTASTPEAAPTEPAEAPEAQAPEEALSVEDDALITLTVENATGMTVGAVHLVACGENEGNDWDAMQEWTYDYLDAPLAPDAVAQIELNPRLSDGCFVMLPVYEDGTAIQEQIQLDGDATHVLTLG